MWTGVVSDSVLLKGTRRGWQGATSRACRDLMGVAVVDVIYLVVMVALFAVVGLVAKGAEKL
jgi:hypothetical protein